MPDYELLYHRLVNAAEDALAALEELNVGLAKKILIQAEQGAEEACLAAWEGAEK